MAIDYLVSSWFRVHFLFKSRTQSLAVASCEAHVVILNSSNPSVQEGSTRPAQCSGARQRAAALSYIMAVAAWEGQHDMFGSMFFGGSGTTGQPPRPGDASVRGMPIDVIEMTGAP